MLDRAEYKRADSDFIDTARRDPETRFVVYAGADALLQPTLPIVPLAVLGGQLHKLGIKISESIFLGQEHDAPWFAVDIEGAAEAARASLGNCGRFVPLAPIRDPIAEKTWSILAQGRALLAWNANSRYCSTCGSLTTMCEAGYVRACTDSTCGALQFPRSDPAIIVRVTNGDRCLLARQPSFPPGLRSVLAGFAEPGESLEAAVTREVEEEVGLNINDLSYVGSQPWPFPTSLMVGFVAETAEEKIRIDGRELESAGWITRDQIRRQTQDGNLLLPSVKSIARDLIDDWLNAVTAPGFRKLGSRGRLGSEESDHGT